jgi:hypothetical protein
VAVTLKYGVATFGKQDDGTLKYLTPKDEGEVYFTAPKVATLFPQASLKPSPDWPLLTAIIASV